MQQVLRIKFPSTWHNHLFLHVSLFLADVFAFVLKNLVLSDGCDLFLKILKLIASFMICIIVIVFFLSVCH